MKVLEANKIKDIYTSIYGDAEFVNANNQTATTMAGDSSIKPAGNAYNIFEVLIEHDDKTNTGEDVHAEISEISCMIPTPENRKPGDLRHVLISIMVINTIGTLTSQKLLEVLINPGFTPHLNKLYFSWSREPKPTI